MEQPHWQFPELRGKLQLETFALVVRHRVAGRRTCSRHLDSTSCFVAPTMPQILSPCAFRAVAGGEIQLNDSVLVYCCPAKQFTRRFNWYNVPVC